MSWLKEALRKRNRQASFELLSGMLGKEYLHGIKSEDVLREMRSGRADKIISNRADISASQSLAINSKFFTLVFCRDRYCYPGNISFYNVSSTAADWFILTVKRSAFSALPPARVRP